MSAKMHTPWGYADQVKPIGTEGILFVSTPSHGGYFVPRNLLHKIPKAHRMWAERWSHGSGDRWYEEDCCWAAVAVAFPELFPADALAHASALVRHYCPEAEPCVHAVNQR